MSLRLTLSAVAGAFFKAITEGEKPIARLNHCVDLSRVPAKHAMRQQADDFPAPSSPWRGADLAKPPRAEAGGFCS